MNSIAKAYALPVLISITLLSWASAGDLHAAESITYRLKWLKNMSTAGDLYADDQGIFEAAGLSVSVKSGGPERDALRELELGYADFGVASADQVIRARARGAPIVVIAQLFQVNPLQWMYHRDRGPLNSPADLKNKTIGVTFGKNDEIIMRTLLAGAQLEDTAVKLFSVRLDYTPFYTGRVDLWPVYINTQGIDIGAKLKRAGVAFDFFDPSRHGVHFVANSVLTSRSTFEKRPNLVTRFADALLKGWHDAMDPKNSDRTVAIVQRYDRDTPIDILRSQLKTTRPLVHPDLNTPIGRIDKQAWQQTETIMLTHKQIDEPVHIVEILKPVD